MPRSLLCLIAIYVLFSLPSTESKSYFFYMPYRRDAYIALAPLIANRVSSLDKVQVIIYAGDTSIDDIRNIFGPTKTVKAPLASFPQSVWADSTSYTNYQSAVGSDGYMTMTLTDDQINTCLQTEFAAAMYPLGITRECTTDMDSSCFSIYPLDIGKLLDSNKHAFWGDTITRAVYNLIVNNEIKNPASEHICVGSPRDCGPSKSVAPEYTACWYAAKQLQTDIPAGVSGAWQFSFYLGEAPFFNGTSPTTPSSSLIKINQAYGTVYPPTPIDQTVALTQKQSVGSIIRKFDPAASNYAFLFHSAPIEILSSTDNPYIYFETQSFTSAGVQVCLNDVAVRVPPVVKAVPASYAVTGYPPFPPGVVMNVGSWVGLGIFLFFFVCIGGFMFLRFCCSVVGSGDNKYTNF